MKRSQRHSAACALVGIVTAGPAAAQVSPAVEATRFEFRAPSGCGSTEEFTARVAKRSSRIRLVSDTTVARSLLVEIQQTTTSAWKGKVTVVESDGTTRTRPLKASSCSEALEALSLIATVTLDPDAMLGEPAAEEPKSEPATPPKESPTKPEPPPARPPVAPAPATSSYRVSFGLEAAALVRVAPEPAWGGAASVGVELRPGAVFSPLGRLTVIHAQRRELPGPAGLASFAFTLPTLDLCPVRLGPHVFGVRPCAYASLGLLRAWGGGTARDETHSRWFGSAGLGLSAGVRVSKLLEIIADGRVGLPFWRDRFAFDQLPFFETPAPALGLGLGLAGGFP